MKTPAYAVIKVNSAGEAKITKRWAAECAGAALAGNESWRRERRGARIGGMRYFRLRCLSTDGDIWWVNPEHVALDGVAFHINDLFNCRCCFGEWLFSASEVSQAVKEIALRKSTAHA
ncbi:MULTISPECIES: hypothetical protein [Enterobacter]|uniref:Uncharacterized protein n=1 Tax=Enterobacter hormaechei subsp. hoffmannii TaxID=1812934 RepID=A0AAI9GE46_9ENTR|nr:MULTISPECIES: hypothetical protein [Enterobacter]MCA7863238.1 hypothetical protein [Escherichia coli]EKU4497688.1 hypothetical protein [Enterobacter hormaechei]ELD4117555.1 hypothetical protein [Enterobacter hormaechei]ELD4146022.1 hypothetical protein [Enterobacter hormaechei]ELQ4521441.1 hypothetical protein [Enterobacter hormaechei]